MVWGVLRSLNRRWDDVVLNKEAIRMGAYASVGQEFGAMPADRRYYAGRGKADMTTLDVWFDDIRLSREHCTFMLVDGEPYVWDQGSFNGTFVNGIDVRTQEPAASSSDRAGGKCKLWDGDEISLVVANSHLRTRDTTKEFVTGYVTFRFEVPDVSGDDDQICTSKVMTRMPDQRVPSPFRVVPGQLCGLIVQSDPVIRVG